MKSVDTWDGVAGARQSLRGAVGRCHRPSNRSFPRYGGRGVTVCDEWRGRGGFERFLEHAGPRPSELHSIDRIDGTKGYEPGNVRWATQDEQGKNKVNLVMVEYRGEEWNVSELARAHGMKPVTLHMRLRRGIPVEEAVEAPVNPSRQPAQPSIEVECCICGVKMTRGYAQENRLAKLRHSEGAVCSSECAWKKGTPPGRSRPSSVGDPEFADWFIGRGELHGDHLLMPSTHVLVDGVSRNVKDVAVELYGVEIPPRCGVQAKCGEPTCITAEHLAVTPFGKIGRRRRR